MFFACFFEFGYNFDPIVDWGKKERDIASHRPSSGRLKYGQSSPKLGVDGNL